MACAPFASQRRSSARRWTIFKTRHPELFLSQCLLFYFVDCTAAIHRNAARGGRSNLTWRHENWITQSKAFQSCHSSHAPSQRGGGGCCCCCEAVAETEPSGERNSTPLEGGSLARRGSANDSRESTTDARRSCLGVDVATTHACDSTKQCRGGERSE